MLTIRLTRKGKKNQPFFKVVVIDKRRSSKGGRAVEVLGYVDPLTKKKSLEKERILYWIKKGAKTSATMNNLLVQEKIIEGKKINVSKIKKSKLAKIEAAKTTKAPVTPIVTPVASAEIPAPAEVVETPAEPKAAIAPPVEATASGHRHGGIPQSGDGVPSEGGKNLIEAPMEQPVEQPKEEPKEEVKQ